MTENGVISAPISVSDVGKTIGSGSTDIGTLCTHKDINIWARYKSVSYPKVAVLRGEGDSEFDALTGIHIGNLSGDIDSVATYEEESRLKHDAPNGGSNNPYRLTDFDGYDHKAQAPISTEWSKNFYINSSYNMRLIIWDRSSDDERKWISFENVLNDIATQTDIDKNELRLCLAVLDLNDEPIYYFFSDTYGSLASKNQFDVGTIIPYDFLNSTDVGGKYTFVVMLCEDFDLLYEDAEETNDSSTPRTYAELGVSASKMDSLAVKPTAYSLCWGHGVIDRQELILLGDWRIAQTYVIDTSPNVFSITDITIPEGFKDYELLCVQVIIPDIVIGSNMSFGSNVEYQWRMRWNQGAGEGSIFPYDSENADGNGNYFGILDKDQYSLSSIPVTQWVEIEQNDNINNVIGDYKYQVVFAGKEYTLIDTDINSGTGIHVYFNMTGATSDNLTIVLDLYYRINGRDGEYKARTIELHYDVSSDTFVGPPQDIII